MTDPVPPLSRSPLGHDRDAGWSVTDRVAIILKSYGVDDHAAARAIVALVLEEAAKVADREAQRLWERGVDTLADGGDKEDMQFNVRASASIDHAAAAIRALKP